MTITVGPPFGFTRRRMLALGAAASASAIVRPRRRPRRLRLDVTQGNVQPMPIAIPDFVGGTPGDTEARAASRR